MVLVKKVMIVKLGMHTADKIVGKTCLKAIRDTFLPMCGLQLRERQGET